MVTVESNLFASSLKGPVLLEGPVLNVRMESKFVVWEWLCKCQCQVSEHAQYERDGSRNLTLVTVSHVPVQVIKVLCRLLWLLRAFAFTKNFVCIRDIWQWMDSCPRFSNMVVILGASIFAHVMWNSLKRTGFKQVLEHPPLDIRPL